MPARRAAPPARHRAAVLTVLLLAVVALAACARSDSVPTPSFPPGSSDTAGSTATSTTAGAAAAPNAAPVAPAAPSAAPATPGAAPAAAPAGPATPATPAAPGTPATTPAAPAASAAAAEPPPGVQPREVIRTDFGALTAVRVGRHPSFDRVVFEFGTTVPGYRIRYVPLPVKADGSGEPVPLNGARTALEVVFKPASGVDGRANPPSQTYAGPVRIAGAETVQLTELARTGDVEAVLSWAAGMRTQVPFTVTTLTGPPRVVIDLRHRP